MSDLDSIFKQEYPEFLGQLETDPESALRQFIKYARPWLMKHPSPGMKRLPVTEQREVVRETVDRCAQNSGDLLKEYAGAPGGFGGWLTAQAEKTCAARSAPPPHPEGRAPRPAPDRGSRPAARVTPPEERPSRAVHAFLQWVRTPWVFLPILVVIAIVFLLGVKSGRQRPAPYVDRSLPVDAALIEAASARDTRFDVLPVGLIPADGTAGERPAETTIFRESPAVVLQLDRVKEDGGETPSRIRIVNGAGETVWSTPIAAGLLEATAFYLRVEPGTVPPDDYEIHVVDSADNLIAHSAIMFR